MSFRLHYTGAEIEGGVQNSPEYSLGGFVASSIIPNGELGNLFDTLSKFSQEQGGFEVKALALKALAYIPQAFLYFNYPKSGSTAYTLPRVEAQSYLFIDSTTLKLTIPVSCVDPQFRLLYQRILDGKMSVEDTLTGTFTNGSTNQVVTSPLISHSIDGANVVINFRRADITLVGSISFAVSSTVVTLTCQNIAANCKIEIAPVTLVGTGGTKMEAISNSRSIPYVGTFYECAGSYNKLNIGSFASGGGIGLWIRRTILTPNPIDNISCKDLGAYVATLSKEERISLKLEY